MGEALHHAPLVYKMLLIYLHGFPAATTLGEMSCTTTLPEPMTEFFPMVTPYAVGAYIAFLDADDWIDTNGYMEMVSALENSGSDIAVCNVYTESD